MSFPADALPDMLLTLCPHVSNASAKVPRLLRQYRDTTLDLRSGRFNIHILPLMLSAFDVNVAPAQWQSVYAALRERLVATRADRISRSVAQPAILGPSTSSSSSSAPAPAPPAETLIVISASGAADSESKPKRQRLFPRGVYANMDKDELVELLLLRDSGIRGLRQDISESTKVEKRLRESLALVRADMVAKESPNDQFDITHRGTKMRVFSLKGQFALAVRRNIGSISAADLGSVVLHAVSHQSVTRFECSLYAASVAACRAFHDDLKLMQVSQILKRLSLCQNTQTIKTTIPPRPQKPFNHSCFKVLQDFLPMRFNSIGFGII